MYNVGQLSDIHTEDIIPVDLNSIIHVNALTLSTWFNQMGNKEKADKYDKIANDLLNAIQEVIILFPVTFCYLVINNALNVLNPIIGYRSCGE